jgi:hypothetical protein
VEVIVYIVVGAVVAAAAAVVVLAVAAVAAVHESYGTWGAAWRIGLLTGGSVTVTGCAAAVLAASRRIAGR